LPSIASAPASSRVIFGAKSPAEPLLPREDDLQLIIEPVADTKLDGGLATPLLPKADKLENAISEHSSRWCTPKRVAFGVGAIAAVVLAVSAFSGLVCASAPMSEGQNLRGAAVGGVHTTGASGGLLRGNDAGQSARSSVQAAKPSTTADSSALARGKGVGTAGVASASGKDAMRHKRQSPQPEPPHASVVGGVAAKVKDVGRRKDAVQHKRQSPHPEPPHASVVGGIAAKVTDVGREKKPISQEEERRQMIAFEAKIIEEGLSCSHPTCDQGFCDQTGCVQPRCDGGHCVQVKTFEASCGGGGCKQSSSSYAQCEGGSCS